MTYLFYIIERTIDRAYKSVWSSDVIYAKTLGESTQNTNTLYQLFTATLLYVWASTLSIGCLLSNMALLTVSNGNNSFLKITTKDKKKDVIDPNPVGFTHPVYIG